VWRATSVQFLEGVHGCITAWQHRWTGRCLLPPCIVNCQSAPQQRHHPPPLTTTPGNPHAQNEEEIARALWDEARVPRRSVFMCVEGLIALRARTVWEVQC